MRHQTTRPRLALPALDRVDDDQVKAAITEQIALRERGRDAYAAVVEAEAGIETAKQADTDHAAAEVRAGRNVPKTGAAEAKAIKALDEARRHDVAVTGAIHASENDLIQLLKTRAPAWTARLEQRAQNARDAMTKALDQLEQAHAEYTSARSLVPWIEDPTRLPTHSISRVQGMTAPNGEQFIWTDVIAALRTTVAPPAQPIPASDQRTWQPGAAA